MAVTAAVLSPLDLLTFPCTDCGAKRQRGSNCGVCGGLLPVPWCCHACGTDARGRYCSACGAEEMHRLVAFAAADGGTAYSERPPAQPAVRAEVGRAWAAVRRTPSKALDLSAALSP